MPSATEDLLFTAVANPVRGLLELLCEGLDDCGRVAARFDLSLPGWMITWRLVVESAGTR